MVVAVTGRDNGDCSQPEINEVQIEPQVIEPKPDIQLVVLDIDGTLVGKSNQIRPRVQQAVQGVKARGIAVAIATGRMYCSAHRFYQDLDLSLPLIAYQGAWVQSPNPSHEESYGQRQHLDLPYDLTLEVINYLKHPQYQDKISIHLYIDDQIHVEKVGPDTEAYLARSQVTAHRVADLRQTLPHHATKLLALCADATLIEQIWQDLNQRYRADQLYLTRSTPFFFEVLHPQANKGQAVRRLTQTLGLSPAQVLAVGDQFNDWEMLNYAGYGVAMGDAPEAVKAIAQWVAPSVEEDGVVAALERFILG